jgi:glycine betaine/choline ABC-type transport system substrate-binding protein
MSTKTRLRAPFALLAASILALGIVACGSSSSSSSTTTGASAQLIQSNPDNSKVTLTIGSKNFTEEYILGEIYAQALQAAGYNVKKQLNLGSEVVALKALKAGQISGYPEYTSTALTSFFHAAPGEVPADAQQAYAKAKTDLEHQGLTAFAPTPFADSNAVGTLTSTAKKLGLVNVSDLQGKSQNLVLDGSPECRQRIDCLVGLEKDYNLQFKKFNPVDIALRYQVLDNHNADLSILFTSDAQLANSNKYTILNDDKGIFAAGNVIFITDQKTVQAAGPDFQKTIEAVQGQLSLKVMQELNARVDIDKQTPKAVAHEYLKSAGYVQ